MSKTLEELNWLERQQLKAIFKKAEKVINKVKQKAEHTIEDREQYKKILESMQEVIDIEDERGNHYTRKDYDNMTTAQLLELTEGALQHGRRNI